MVTVKIVSIGEQDDLLVGIDSLMKSLPLKAGIHDIEVGPGQCIDLSGVPNVEFVAVRNAS